MARRASLEIARRTAELILWVQRAGPRGVPAWKLAEAWGLHERSVRRLLGVLEAASAGAAEAGGAGGRLRKLGRGREARAVWEPAPDADPPRWTETASLLLALGPWEAIGATDVVQTLGRLLEQVEDELPVARRRRLEDLRRRGFWYQPYGRRPPRDPGALDAVLSALLHGTELHVRAYHRPSGEPSEERLLPWTLVHALDGLYVLGPRAAAPEEPRMWAMHRMEGAGFVRGTSAERPKHYEPAELLGHGFGPFVATPGRVELLVPEGEAPYVLEYDLPCQAGPATRVKGGWKVELATGMQPGLRIWARGMGCLVREGHGAGRARRAGRAASPNARTETGEPASDKDG
jgi:predicted DNA-binding transcriptional regulator YafY